MKAYKITLLVIDHDNIGPKEAAEVLENARYPNRCINPSVMAIETAELGEWTDDNPLNNNRTFRAAFEVLFPGAK